MALWAALAGISLAAGIGFGVLSKGKGKKDEENE